MLRNTGDLQSYKILARDGEVGSVHDFYFDDQRWVIRYLVVDTGSWLPGRKVLISPVAIDQPAWRSEQLPVDLTKEQVESSPDIELDQPISEQQTAKLHRHYQWPPLNRVGGGLLESKIVGMQPDSVVETSRSNMSAIDETSTGSNGGDPHLRSMKEVSGYYIEANDGEIGHIEEFMVDDDSWTVHYLVVDTRNWLPGRKVLISPAWIKEISWPNSKVYLDLSRETVKNSPEYDPSKPIDREYEARLHEHYDQPKYWV